MRPYAPNSFIIQLIVSPALRMRLMRHAILWPTAMLLIFRGFQVLGGSIQHPGPDGVLYYAILSTLFFGGLTLLAYSIITSLTRHFIILRFRLGLFLAGILVVHIGASEIVLAHYWLLTRLLSLAQLPKFYTAYADHFTNLPFWKAPIDSVIVWIFSFSLVYSYLLYTVSLKVFKDLLTLSLRQVNLEKENLRLEFDFLKAQINPHFLFNTLNNIYSFAYRAPERVAPLILRLADLMRYTLYETTEEQVPLTKELAFLTSYVELQRIRHDDHVSIDFSITGQPNGTLIAPLLLIVFVENAFKHGIQSSAKAAWVKIQIQIQPGLLSFQVDNSIPQTKQVEPVGIGLKNVEKRLTYLYPQHHQLRILPSSTQFSISLTLNLHASIVPRYHFG